MCRIRHFRPTLSGLGELGTGREALTLLRLEGITASVAHRADALARALSAHGPAQMLEDAASAAVWSSIRDVKPFAADGALGAWPVWRIVCPPASGGALGERLARDTGGDVIYDWGGGLIWAALPPRPDARAALVRQHVDAAFGHATLIRAPEQVRRNVDVFHPQPGGLAGLSERVRLSFDPKNILNRGRMSEGAGGMKTEFSLAQLADPDIAEADKILRACVHCGFCTATCPTYVLLGDELDSPRGRIYLIKEMLEKDAPPTREVVKHIDRCLSCLACMTTCPSGVNYMHLVDQARVRIEQQYARPLTERMLRAVLALVLPRPKLFRICMVLARIARPLAALLPTPKVPSATPDFVEPNQGDAGPCAGPSAAAGRGWRKRFCSAGRAARTRRVIAGLCPAGSGAPHQPGRHQSVDASRHRGRAGQG